MEFLFLLIVGFLVGSIPFGLLIGKWMLGMDIRQAGSGNIGMTNVMRVGGKLPGALTFLLDFAKGTAMMLLAQPLLEDASGTVFVIQWSCVGIAVIGGHVFSIFLKFKGGKGISTLFGVLAALHFSIAGVAALLWVGTFLLKGISSLAAVVMLAALPFLFLSVPWVLEEPIPVAQAILFGGLSIFLLYRHRENIARLLKGEEQKLQPSSPKDSHLP